MKCQAIFTLAIALSYSLISPNLSYAQTKKVRIQSQLADSLFLWRNIHYKLVLDGDSVNTGILSDLDFEIPIPDSIIQLSFTRGVQPFYNEYKPEDVANLRHITLHYKNYIRGATPRFFLNEIMTPIESVADSLEWFIGYLDHPPEILGYELYVYNSKKITFKEKRKLKKLHHRIDDYMGDTTELVYMNEPYPCSDVDPFNYQTKITQDFINSQNTKAMREQANNFSLVIMMVRKYDESLITPKN